jgi:putative ABC transport system substrate-binding protein
VDRRVFLSFLAGGALTAPVLVGAQTSPVSKTFRIVGILSESLANSKCRDPLREIAKGKSVFMGGERTRTLSDCLASDPLVAALRAIGRGTGTIIRIEERGGPALEELVRELVRANAEIVVALGSPATLAAKRVVTDKFPIVMAGVSDPVGLGLVASLARPGGNITGVSFLGLEVVGKSVELLVQMAPSVRRVAVLSNPASIGAAFVLKSLKSVHPSGIEILSVEVRTADETSRMLQELKPQKPDGLVVLEDLVFAASESDITAFARVERLPTVFHLSKYALNGALMAYGPSETEIYERSANYVSRILKGAKPADLPVEQPTKFEFVINLKTAKALGLTIPPSLLQRADQVIE